MDKINESASPVEHGKTTTNTLPILLATLVGLLLIVIFIFIKRRTSSRNAFLLTGLSEAGKSAIFMQLLYQKFPDTFTSVTENVGAYRSLRLIDIPGHYRVRDKCFDQHKRSAKGVIFVVDSSTAQKEIRDVADALYTILSDAATSSCPFLILCNKQDITTSKSAQVIKSALEKEMNIVRNTRSRKLKSTGEDESSSKTVFLGSDGKDFEFSHLNQNVQFFESSCKLNHLSELSDWMDRML